MVRGKLLKKPQQSNHISIELSNIDMLLTPGVRKRLRLSQRV
jgi:hypothetical protein